MLLQIAVLASFNHEFDETVRCTLFHGLIGLGSCHNRLVLAGFCGFGGSLYFVRPFRWSSLLTVVSGTRDLEEEGGYSV